VARIAFDNHFADHLPVFRPAEHIYNRLPIIDHCGGYKFVVHTRLEKGCGPPGTEMGRNMWEQTTRKRFSPDTRETESPPYRKVCRVYSDELAGRFFEEKGVGPQILVEAFSKPPKVFENTVQWMPGWAARSSPKANHFGCVDRLKRSEPVQSFFIGYRKLEGAHH